MEVLSPSAPILKHRSFPSKADKTQPQNLTLGIKVSNFATKRSRLHLSSSNSSLVPALSFSTTRSATSPSRTKTLTSTFTSTSPSLSSIASDNHHWLVLMEAPQQGFNSKPEVIDYYVKTLERVLGSERDAQMCIYETSWDTQFTFCCDIDEETAGELAGVPGVVSVMPDPNYGPVKKTYGSPSIQSSNLSCSQIGSNLLFPAATTKHWLVQMEKPGAGVVTKAQMVDYYAQALAKVLGNEQDAQMCMYHVSWQSNFGFCCELDDECAQQLAGVPGVLSVHPDRNFESENKDNGGNNLHPTDLLESSEATQTTPIKTKKLFITGLSFYTSEKTLRAAFEGFGDIVEVKIIMDKISKRSKGYAFIEYTTEEAASAALKEMNGKIINGWMIVVDVAKSNPPRYSKGRAR